MKPSRHLLRLRFAAAVALLAVLPACSLLHRHKEAAPATTQIEPVVGRKTTSKGLTVELRAVPDPVKLGEVRQIDVTFILRNAGKQNVTLKFTTSQMVDILLREQASGKVVSQWSTDQTFQPAARNLIVNAHERVEYNLPITTRELHAGMTYELEAYFVGYEKELRTSRPLIPLP